MILAERYFDMARFLSIVFADLLCAIAVQAGPISYNIIFTPPITGSPAPTSASFTYDGSMFTSFPVMWNGDMYGLDPSANSAARYNPPYGGCDPGVTGGPQLAFIIMTQGSTGCATPPTYVFTVGNQSGSGNLPRTILVYFAELEGGNVVGSFSVGACCSDRPTANFSSSWILSPEPGTLIMPLMAWLTVLGLKRVRLIVADTRTDGRESPSD
jgi:hypothetical protein